MSKKFIDLANLKSNLENFLSEIITPTFATKEAVTEQLGNHTVKSDVPENAVFTDTVYDDTDVKEEIDEINSNLTNDYSALLGYDIYNLVDLDNKLYSANQSWFTKEFVAPFDGYVFFMVQTSATSGAFTQVFHEDNVLVSNNEKNIADYNTWGCAYQRKITKGKTYKFVSYTNTSTEFNKVMLCIRKTYEVPTKYVPYAPSNIEIAGETKQINSNLGYLSYGESAGGTNLFNKAKIKYGYEVNPSNGTIFNSTDHWISDFIKVKPNTTYTVSGCIYYCLAGYNSSKTYDSTPTYSRSGGSFTTGSSVEYIRISDGNASIDTFQLEEGSTATDYEPYIPSVKMLAEDVDSVKNDLSSLGYKKAQFSLVDNKYITIEGDEASYNGWSATDYIDCTNGTKLCVYSPKMDDTKKYNCFYDSNKNFISNFVLEDGYTYIDIPKNASYFRMSGISNVIGKFVAHVCSNLMAEVCNTKNNLEQLEYSDIAGGKNILDYTNIGGNFANNVIGTSFSYLNGEYIIKRIADVNSGIYTYSKLLNVLDGKKIRLSFDAKTDASGMCMRLAIGESGIKEQELTTSYNRYAIEFDLTSRSGIPLIFYGNTVAGNMYIKNIMFEDITNSESVDSTYEPHIPSVKMLAEDVDTLKNDLDGQDLLNNFDGKISQGTVRLDGTPSGEQDYICATDFYTVNANGIVRLTYPSVIYMVLWGFTKEGTRVNLGGENTTEKSWSIPSNIVKVKWQFGSDGITPSNARNIGIYIDNDIDIIKDAIDSINDYLSEVEGIVSYDSYNTVEFSYDSSSNRIIAAGTTRSDGTSKDVITSIENSLTSLANAINQILSSK